MTQIFIIFMSIILLLAILMMIAAGRDKGSGESGNAPFINGDGDHVYYDRKLIERKELQKRHPEENAKKTPGTSGRHFGKRPEGR